MHGVRRERRTSSSYAGANSSSTRTQTSRILATRRRETPETPVPRRDAAHLVRRARRLGGDHGGADQADLPRGVAGQPGDGLGTLRLGRTVAGRVLPRREDRVHGQPGDAGPGGLRAERGRPAADVALWRRQRGAHPDHGPRGSSVCAAVVRIPPRSGYRTDRSSRRARRPATGADDRDAERHHQRSARARGRSAADVESWAAARQRRIGRRRPPPLAAVRSGHAAQRAGHDRRGQAREHPCSHGKRLALRRARAGVQGRDGVRRPAHDVVGYRHGRSRAAKRARWVSPPFARTHGRAPAFDGRESEQTCSRRRLSSRRRSSRIDEPRDVRRLRMRLSRRESLRSRAAGRRPDGRGRRRRNRRSAVAARGIGRTPQRRRRAVSGARTVHRERPIRRSWPKPRRAVRGRTGARARAERLMRYVNAMLEKKPTVSLPSAREVLRTKVGDCNEHTALYVAMARAPASRRASPSGLTFVRGAFYYHAWPEVYLDEGDGRRGYWLPVDPTLNQFPADAHASAPRPRRPRQASGDPAAHRTDEDAGAGPRVGAGVDADSGRPRGRATSPRWRFRCRSVSRGGCWTGPPPTRDDRRPRSGQEVRQLHGGRRREPRGAAGRDSRVSRAERRRQDDHDSHDCRAPQADGWPGGRERSRSRDGPGSGQGIARIHPGSPVHLREAHGRRVSAVPRRSLRHGRRWHRRSGAKRCSRCSSCPDGSTSSSRASRTA